MVLRPHRQAMCSVSLMLFRETPVLQMWGLCAWSIALLSPCGNLDEQGHNFRRRHTACVEVQRLMLVVLAWWKIHAGQLQTLLQLCPVKRRSRVRLALRRNVFMPGDVGDRVALHQCAAQWHQCVVLGRLEGLAFQSFELHANGVVVAAAAPAVTGRTRVPGALVAIYKLQHLATAADKEVGGDAHALQPLVVRMRGAIECAHKKRFHLSAAVVTRRQADGMHHQQIDLRVRGAFVAVG